MILIQVDTREYTTIFLHLHLPHTYNLHAISKTTKFHKKNYKLTLSLHDIACNERVIKLYWREKIGITLQKLYCEIIASFHKIS